MARINTNVGAVIANTNLQKSQQALSTSLQRLPSFSASVGKAKRGHASAKAKPGEQLSLV